MIQIFQIAIDIIIYNAVQIGANTQLGGLKLGWSMSEYQGSLKLAVITPPIIEGIKVIKSEKLTNGAKTIEFEKKFSKFIKSKYCLMVNSGSSANLLAAFALINPKKKNFLRCGDEFIIQSLCWSTSLWPMIQAGLKPKFIDVNFDSFNIDYNVFSKATSKKTKALMLVHVLGNSSKISSISKYFK